MVNRINELLDSIIAHADEIRALSGNPTPEPSTNRVHVQPGDDVQAAFDSLRTTGGVLDCEPGTYSVDLVITERPIDSKLIVVAGIGEDRYPKAGQRITADYLPALPTFQNKSPTREVIKAKNRARNVAFVNVGIAPPLNPSYTQIALGGDRNETPTPDNLPTNFLFDRMYVFGDPVKGAHRGIQAHANGVKVTGSCFHDIFEVGRDSQAISSWNGGRNLLIENTELEASGENVMFGGSDSASLDMTTQDVIIRGSTFRKQYAWMALPTPPSIKSLFEVKNVKRLMVDGCVFENNWARDWPTGVAIMLKACNGNLNEVWATCEDVEFANCLIRNVGSVFGLVGYGDSQRVSDRMRRVKFSNILAYDINVDVWKGTGKGCATANPPDGLTIDHVSMLKNGHSWMNTWFDSAQPPGEKLTFTNSVAVNGSYGYMSAKGGMGMLGLMADWQAIQVDGNVFQKGSRSLSLPLNNAILDPATFDVSFDLDYRVIAGSAVATAVTTTDGKLPGADVDAIIQRTGEF
jgi:hypothetical protein